MSLQEAGNFTDEQLVKMWGLWKQCIAAMAVHKAQEQQVTPECKI